MSRFPTSWDHGLHAIVNFKSLSAKFTDINPIEQTMNSYKNHEFIPTGKITMNEKGKN